MEFARNQGSRFRPRVCELSRGPDSPGKLRNGWSARGRMVPIAWVRSVRFAKARPVTWRKADRKRRKRRNYPKHRRSLSTAFHALRHEHRAARKSQIEMLPLTVVAGGVGAS